MAPQLYPGDLVYVQGRDGIRLGLALVDAIEQVRDDQAGAWCWPIVAGRVDRRSRYYWPRRRLIWSGLCTVPRPGRIRRRLTSLLRAMGRAQLQDVPEVWAVMQDEGDPDEQTICTPCSSGPVHCQGRVSWCECECSYPEDP